MSRKKTSLDTKRVTSLLNKLQVINWRSFASVFNPGFRIFNLQTLTFSDGWVLLMVYLVIKGEDKLFYTLSFQVFFPGFSAISRYSMTINIYILAIKSVIIPSWNPGKVKWPNYALHLLYCSIPSLDWLNLRDGWNKLQMLLKTLFFMTWVWFSR